MNEKDDKKELLQRFGWMLFDDVNRRLGILIEECSHLQQVVHYHGDFDIADKEPCDLPTQREMEHFKQTAYAYNKSFSFVSEALYDHLGGLILGLKSLQTEVRERFEVFLKTKDNNRDKEWFWFVALRGHILQVVLDQYMTFLEHAHEKLIQILETKPGQLPQAILLRRWNSALHGRFLSEYSRHLDWETNVLLNNLKKSPLSEQALQDARGYSSFIHSWAHTPTSMVTTFLVTDKEPKGETKKCYKLGSIRSAFFYLEMPQLYPLLYHECAHLQFEWNENITDDGGDFFIYRRKAIETLEENCESSFVEIRGGWQNFVDEICADALAISLGNIPYFTALVLQLMGQGSGCFFYTDASLPLQEWAKQHIYDLERPGTDYYDVEQGKTDEFFWQARLKLALDCLKIQHPKDCSKHDNQQWLIAVELGIAAYQQGGEAVFAAHRISDQHQYFWRRRETLNDWVFNTIIGCKLPSAIKIPNKIFSNKYFLDENIIKNVLAASVCNFEKQFFGEHYYHGDKCAYKTPLNKHNKKTVSIEYLVFHVKWYLSKRVIKEIGSIGSTSKNKSIETFTYAYANFIYVSSAGIFRIALEWLIARNDLYATFIDHLEDTNATKDQFVKLKLKGTDIEQELNNIHFDALAKKMLTHYLRFRTHRKLETQMDIVATSTYCNVSGKLKIIKKLNKIINDYMEENVVNRFKILHVGTEKNPKPVSIGTFTLGSFSKHRVNSDKAIESHYLNGAAAVYNNFDAVNKCINNSEIHVPNASMPYDYNKQAVFSYPGIGSGKDCSGLYFITGDYDFIYHQAGITPSEFTCHPYRQLPILTKSRTVLDICKHFENEDGKEIKREPCGRISLIKFRYRWEMYDLAKNLEQQTYRSRLRLSSAWEDGVLSSWHPDVGALWNDAYHQELSSPVEGGSMDTQSSLILFKLEDGKLEAGEPRKPVQAHDDEEFSFSPIAVNAKELLDIIKELHGSEILEEAYISQGRFDYTVEWKAKTPVELAALLFRLPTEFWQNTSHINTSFGHKLGDDYSCSRFFSEITTNRFPPIKKKPSAT